MRILVLMLALISVPLFSRRFGVEGVKGGIYFLDNAYKQEPKRDGAYE